MRVYVCTYMHVRMWICTCMCVYVYTGVYMYVRVYMCVYMYVYVRVCTCVLVCACVLWIHTHHHTFPSPLILISSSDAPIPGRRRGGWEGWSQADGMGRNLSKRVCRRHQCGLSWHSHEHIFSQNVCTIDLCSLLTTRLPFLRYLL